MRGWRPLVALRSLRPLQIAPMTKRILVLPGDGIGPEIVAEAVKVLDHLAGEGLDVELDEGLIGGAAYDAAGSPLPESTLAMAREADAVLLGAVGGPK